MSKGPGLFRTCPLCGHEYKASRPACPNCGKPPFTRRRYIAMSGPRMLVLLGFLFFVSLALYTLLIPPDKYEQYRSLVFGLPRTASLIVGASGASVFLGVLATVFLRRKA